MFCSFFFGNFCHSFPFSLFRTCTNTLTESVSQSVRPIVLPFSNLFASVLLHSLTVFFTVVVVVVVFQCSVCWLVTPFTHFRFYCPCLSQRKEIALDILPSMCRNIMALKLDSDRKIFAFGCMCACVCVYIPLFCKHSL